MADSGVVINFSDVKTFAQAIKNLNHRDYDKVREIRNLFEVFKENQSQYTDDDWLEVVLECVKVPQEDILRIGSTIIDKIIKFKKSPDAARKILEQMKTKPEFDANLTGRKSHDLVNKYKALCGEIEDLKEMPAGKKAGPAACDLAMLTFTNYHPYYSACAHGLLDMLKIAWKSVSVQYVEEFVDSVTKMFESNMDGQLIEDDSNLSWVLSRLEYFWSGIKVTPQHKKMVETTYRLFKLLGTDKDILTNNEGRLNTFGHTYNDIMLYLLNQNANNVKTLTHLEMFFADCMVWKMMDTDDLDEGQQRIQASASRFMDSAVKTSPELTSNFIETIVQLLLKKKSSELLYTIQEAYEKYEACRPIVDKYIPGIVEMLTTLDSPDNSSDRSTAINLLYTVAQKNPKVLESSIDKLEPYMSDADGTMVAGILTAIVRKNPEVFRGRGNNYFDLLAKTGSYSAYLGMPIFAKIAQIDEQEAERAISIMEKESTRQNNEKGLVQNMLYYWLIIASTHPEPLRKRIPKLEQMKKVPDLKMQAQHLIDVLEGRSLAKVSEDLEQQQEEIEELDERVTLNEQDVDDLTKQADEQQEELDQAKETIAENQERVGELEERVDVAEENIEELDNKTVTSAPAWAKQLSMLLNAESENDYRLVAQRLGYRLIFCLDSSNIQQPMHNKIADFSSDDIRGWAMQSDPTMSMLAEFYTTNKTSEATHFLLAVLKEIDRQDAATVIEKSLRDVQNVVHDKPQGYEKPPPVFLSYQWGHQDEVKLLKQDLEKEGYACWMDIGQMGGGDSLYEEIDAGIRPAKVVVLCMSEKYCKSPNCIREVNLSNGLGKRIIPIQMEKIDWPPPGSLGPILAEKLFIRFYKRDNENVNDERCWPHDKYKELVEQIGENVDPDPEVFAEAKGEKPSAEPKETPPKVRRKTDLKNKPSKISSNRPLSPPNKKVDYDVLISCSPESAKDMELLAFSLRDFGYDTAIANYVENSILELSCKCVICALSLRYSKSNMAANEIVQNYRLSRPVIPIILDKAVAYPPVGSLNKVLSSLQPISCSSVQNQWDDSPELDMILNKLEENSFFNRKAYEKGAQRRTYINHRSQSVPTQENKHGRLRQDRHGPFKEYNNNTSYSDYELDSEKEIAKRMQHESKLPQIKQNKNEHDLHSQRSNSGGSKGSGLSRKVQSGGERLPPVHSGKIQ